MARIIIHGDFDAAREELRRNGIILTKHPHRKGGFVCYADKTLRKQINLNNDIFMNDTSRIRLSEMKARLQAQVRFDHPDRAFDALLYGWVKKCHHGLQWLSAAKKRGWLSERMAHELEAYCGYKMT